MPLPEARRRECTTSSKALKGRGGLLEEGVGRYEIFLAKANPLPPH